MPSPSNAARNNSITTKTFERRFLAAFGDINNSIAPALDEIGRIAIEHSVQTHEYQNRTGRLEESHDHVVVGAGQTISVNFQDGKDQISTDTFSSAPNEISLFIFTHRTYGLWVEIKNGFSVLINSFLMLRRDGRKMLSNRLKAKRT